MAKELEKRAVTSSLIFKLPSNCKPLVALFQRSSQVRTYQGKYAPISGSIEHTDTGPLACAWREIHEETTLTPSSLHLLRQGKPFTFPDERAGREWTVHPFSFVLEEADEGRIQIDWEHVGWKWFDPYEVAAGRHDGEAVPRLDLSLRRVWFEYDLGPSAGGVLSAGLKRLREDRESGARQLAAAALGVLGDTLVEIPDNHRWWRNARFAAWHVWKNGRESMGAAVLHLVLSALQALHGGELRGEEARAAVEGVREASESDVAVQEAFVSFLKERGRRVTLLTLSASSTVTACLLHALSSSLAFLDIRILESRPLFEGVTTARRVAAVLAGHEDRGSLSVFADAAAALAAKDVDIVLLGADLIDKSGNLCNKTGSLPAVLAAKHVSPRAQVVVLSETGKVLPFDPPEEEKADAREMTSAWPSSSYSGFHVDNISFEWVDAGLIDYYVTERGPRTPLEMSQAAEEVRQRADRFFSDL